MRKIQYNLAATRKIDVRAFALIAAVIFLAVVLLNVITILNLTRQQRQSRAEIKEIRFITQKLAELDQKTLRRQNEITGWKKTWGQKLAFVNALIERKCFSFIFRLNFLEKVCSGSMRVRQLRIANDQESRMQITINALAQNELLELYKKLLSHELVIGSENQITESYQASLSFKIKDEKN